MKKLYAIIALFAIAMLSACGVLPSGPYRAMNSQSDVRVATVDLKGVCDISNAKFCYDIKKGDKVIVRRDAGKTLRVLMAGDITVNVPADAFTK